MARTPVKSPTVKTPLSTVDKVVKVEPVEPGKKILAKTKPLVEVVNVEPDGTTQMVVYKGKKGENKEVWDPTDYYKDADFFHLVFGLPNEGILPHKIADITDDQLVKVFGTPTKNGYKVSNICGIPAVSVLALSHAVDGHEKPMNNIYSHTFAKGVYADFLQNRKVNWAAYASTKLKGQVTQWIRDGKGKPEGPPVIQKPMLYLRHITVVPNPAPLSKAKQTELEVLQPVADQIDLLKAAEPHSCDPELPLVHSIPPKIENPIASKNLLISIMESEMSRMRERLAKVKDKFNDAENSVQKLKIYEAECISDEKTLRSEVEKLREQERALAVEIRANDDRIGELTSDIELESNKVAEDDGGVPEKVNAELLKYMTDELATHEATAKDVEGQLKLLNNLLSNATANLDRKLKKRPDTEVTFSRLSKASAALTAERVKIESLLQAQEVEFNIVSTVFSTASPLVITPFYIPTSTKTVNSEVDVSNCPICCNGYHCFNWIPASCGHTFHPACLFASILSSTEAPKCFACGDAFNYDWLRTWGIERGQGSVVRVDTSLPRHQTWTTEMEDVYGKNCGMLAQRRMWVKNLEKDLHSRVQRCESTLVLSSIVELSEDGEHRSSKALLVPKVEGESKNKRKGPDVEPSSKKPRKSLSRNAPF